MLIVIIVVLNINYFLNNLLNLFYNLFKIDKKEHAHLSHKPTTNHKIRILILTLFLPCGKFVANAVSLIFWLANLDAINLGGAGKWDEGGRRGGGASAISQNGGVPETGGVVFEMERNYGISMVILYFYLMSYRACSVNHFMPLVSFCSP